MPGELGTLDGRVVDEFDGVAVGQDFSEMKESCQFEDYCALTSLPDFQVQGCNCIDGGGRLNVDADLVGQNVDCVRPAYLGGGLVAIRAFLGWGIGGPDVVVS